MRDPCHVIPKVGIEQMLTGATSSLVIKTSIWQMVFWVHQPTKLDDFPEAHGDLIINGISHVRDCERVRLNAIGPKHFRIQRVA